MINQDNFKFIEQNVNEAALTQEQRLAVKRQTEMVELLEQLYRITPDTELPPMEFLFSLFGEPCFPRGELVALTGRAKSGKTFALSIIMTLAAVSEILSFKREQAAPLKVLWYDTEQSRQSTLDILKNRIIPLFHQSKGHDSEFPSNSFFIFNVREAERKERRGLMKAAISQYQPDLVIIDGIRDLVDDINDGIAAQDIMEELMRIAQHQNCCIVCVLHQNKASESRDPRGWLGTELLNKAFDVFATEKLMPQHIFKFEQLYTRKYDIEQSLYFEVCDKGLPVLVKEPPIEFQKPEGNIIAEERPTLNNDYVIHTPDGKWEMDFRKLFTDALKGRDMLTGAALRYQVKLLGSIATNRLYNNCLDKAMQSGLLEKWKDNNGRVCYQLRKADVPSHHDMQQELFSESEDASPF